MPEGKASGLRAFRGTFYVAINEGESLDWGVDEKAQEPRPASVADVQEWLKEAIVLDVDFEDAGDPHGFQSMELKWDTLREMTPEEVARLYNV